MEQKFSHTINQFTILSLGIFGFTVWRRTYDVHELAENAPSSTNSRDMTASKL